MRAGQLRTEGGLGLEELASSAFRVFAMVQYHFGPAMLMQEWDGLSCEQQDGWAQVALRAFQLAETKAEEPPQIVATKFFEAWHAVAFPGLAMPAFGDQPPIRKLAWEAAARHLCFLVAEAEEDEDVGHMERVWPEWARMRVASQPQEDFAV